MLRETQYRVYATLVIYFVFSSPSFSTLLPPTPDANTYLCEIKLRRQDVIPPLYKRRGHRPRNSHGQYSLEINSEKREKKKIDRNFDKNIHFSIILKESVTKLKSTKENESEISDRELHVYRVRFRTSTPRNCPWRTMNRRSMFKHGRVR